MQSDDPLRCKSVRDSTTDDLNRELTKWRLISLLICLGFFISNIFLLSFKQNHGGFDYLVQRVYQDGTPVAGHGPTSSNITYGVPVNWLSYSRFDHGWNRGITNTRKVNYYYVLASFFVSLTAPLFVLDWWMRPAFDAFAADRRYRIVPKPLTYFVLPVLFVSLFVAVLSTFLPICTVTTSLH